MVTLLAVVLADAGEPDRYRVVVGRKVDDLQAQLHDVAAQGYGVIQSCSGSLPMFRTRSAGFLLLEKLPPDSLPPEYLVVAGSGWLKALQEAGTRGFQLPRHGIIERGRQFFLPAPGTALEWTQAVFVLERSKPEIRMDYDVERLPRDVLDWSSLAARVAEGYQVLTVSAGRGALLARHEGAERMVEMKPDHFTMVSGMRKKKLFPRLDAKAQAGYRVMAVLYSVTRGGSYNLLLERVAEPGQGYEYRFVPQGKGAVAAMNEWGAEGFRVHRSAWWIMERESDAQVGYEYRLLEAKDTDELTEILRTVAGEEYGIRIFCSRTILAEKQKPLF